MLNKCMPYEKIGSIPVEIYELLKSGETLPKKVKEHLNISLSENYMVGDSIINVGCNTKQMDVFKAEHEGKSFYYVVTAPIDENRALTVDIYPTPHIL